MWLFFSLSFFLFISTWPPLAIVLARSPEMSLHGEDKL